MINVIFGFGPPAATKGATFKLVHSTAGEEKCARYVVSDLIREHFKKDGVFRKKALQLQSNRDLIPCGDIDFLVRTYVQISTQVTCIDGGPRTVAQVYMFNEYFRQLFPGVGLFLVDFGEAPDAFFDALFLHTQHAPDRVGRVDGDKLQTHQKGVALYRANRSGVLDTAESLGWRVIKIDPRYTLASKAIKLFKAVNFPISQSKVIESCRQMNVQPLPDFVLRAA